MLLWIREQIGSSKFSKNDLRKIEIAAEEALVNIIQHGYKGSQGDIQLTIELLELNMVQITIEDRGPAFNPLEADMHIDKQAPIEDRTEGGLGIILIRQYMDEVFYQRLSDVNCLTLIKQAESS